LSARNVTKSSSNQQGLGAVRVRRGVADRGMRKCVDPEGNVVTMGGEAEGGLGPPSGEQHKQLICNSGGDKTSMAELGGQPDRLDATSRTHHAQSM
jgi:hypothetical protein